MKRVLFLGFAIVCAAPGLESSADACGLKLGVKSAKGAKGVQPSPNPSRILIVGDPPSRVESNLARAGHIVEVSANVSAAKAKDYRVVLVEDSANAEKAHAAWPEANVLAMNRDPYRNLTAIEKALERSPTAAMQKREVIASSEPRKKIAAGPDPQEASPGSQLVASGSEGAAPAPKPQPNLVSVMPKPVTTEPPPEERRPKAEKPADKAEKADNAEKAEAPEKPAKPDKHDKRDKHAKADKRGKAGRHGPAEKSAAAEKAAPAEKAAAATPENVQVAALVPLEKPAAETVNAAAPAKTEEPAPAKEGEPSADATPPEPDPPTGAVQFGVASDVLSGLAKARLRVHAAWLKSNPTGKLVLEGHTDATGTSEENLELSRRRAEAAARYLAELGVDASRIETTHFGEDTPVYGGRSDDPRNRCVVIRAQ